MAVTRDQLVNRDGGQGRRDDPSFSDRLAQLEERVKEARTVKLAGQNLHCEDCFQRGRNAALKFLEGEE